MPTILPITDFLDPQLDIYARLSENQLLNRCDPQNGIFIAESPKVIERALDAGCIPISFLTEDRHLENQALPFLERCPDIPFFSAPFEVLTQLTGFALTRGMLCAMKRPKLPSVEELCQASSRLVILENIMNPTNIGAIFRSAAALGMDGVLLTSDCSNPLYRRAIRVSMGTVFQIPWTFLDSSWPLPGISELKNHGFHTVSMALRCDSVSIDDPKPSSKQKLAVILGSEGEGLLDETIDNCDDTVCIPMFHGFLKCCRCKRSRILGAGEKINQVSRQPVARLSSARDNLLFKPYQNGSKTPENQGLIVIRYYLALRGAENGVTSMVTPFFCVQG